jgi:hypothetical protein
MGSYFCSECNGTGISYVACPHCQGAFNPQYGTQAYVCNECNGYGYLHAPCSRCNGTGEIDLPDAGTTAPWWENTPGGRFVSRAQAAHRAAVTASRDRIRQKAADDVLSQGGEPLGPNTFQFQPEDAHSEHLYPCIYDPRMLFRLAGEKRPVIGISQPYQKTPWEWRWPLDRLPRNKWVRLKDRDGNPLPIAVLVQPDHKVLGTQVFGKWIPVTK